jgi:hypothetical protein
MLMKTENRREKLMREPEQCDSLLLASSKAGSALIGVADAVLDRKAEGLAAQLQGLISLSPASLTHCETAHDAFVRHA